MCEGVPPPRAQKQSRRRKWGLRQGDDGVVDEDEPPTEEELAQILGALGEDVQMKMALNRSVQEVRGER